MAKSQSVVAITIATITEPVPRDGGDPVRHLVGAALFHIARNADDDFTYSLSVRTVPAGVGEAVLVDWLIEHLPTDAKVVGWRLADEVVPAILDAANEASPAAALSLVNTLALAFDNGTVDLAEDHGGVAAPSLAQICSESNVASLVLDPAVLLAAWGIGQMWEVAEALGVNSVAAWRLSAGVTLKDAVPCDTFVAEVVRAWRGKTRAALTSHEFRHAAATQLFQSSRTEVGDE